MAGKANTSQTTLHSLKWNEGGAQGGVSSNASAVPVYHRKAEPCQNVNLLVNLHSNYGSKTD